MALPMTSTPKARAPHGYDGPVIDTDVHQTWRSPRELLPYLPPRWRALVEGGVSTAPRKKSYPFAYGSSRRMDSFPPDGGPPGSSLQLMQDQLLGPYNVERAVLGYDVGAEAAHENPYFAAALASAANDWCVDHWLTDGDPRLHGLVLVPTQVPAAAAAEVARVGGHPRMVGVLFPDGGLGLPFGHPVYHPIFEAAVEHDLPVVIHFGMNMWSPMPHLSAGGLPQSHMEFYTVLNQAAMHHATSLITHGVFERWPSLRVLILEVGCMWVPWLFTQLDAQYATLQQESPWVKRLPSEYLTQHIRISTQPIDTGDRPSRHQSLLHLIDGFDDVLMFSSDYPHWDTDQLAFVGRQLPAEWHPKVFHGNALSSYRWPS